MCRSPNGTAPANLHVAREIPKDDDGGDVDPTMPSFNLGINQDEIDVSGRLSPETIDVDGSPLVPIRVIIPPDFNEVERERVYRWVMDDKEPKKCNNCLVQRIPGDGNKTRRVVVIEREKMDQQSDTKSMLHVWHYSFNCCLHSRRLVCYDAIRGFSHALHP
ncbi:hypothetical protein PIB30_025368 [Stylosanthes scabra]|uniref:Uncharacterized protein n=1 Tax=Stylosanthes scabra TaxID=79078 RepID=A0ABU6Z6Q3_9FABA|nr:hypothetical protein [Stylosanthes scabra]